MAAGAEGEGAGRLGEFELIRRFFAPLTDAPHGLNLTDDAGLLPRAPEGMETVVTKDMIVAGVHYLPDDPADLVARKLLRVNLSDLAAKGAVPVGYVLGAAFGEGANDAWIEAFARGLGEDQAIFGVTLLGGDTVRTPGPSTFSLTAFGHVPQGKFVGRSGAKPGDGVYVTGTVGDAHLGLRVLTGKLADLPMGRKATLIAAYRLPNPRTGFGPFLPGFAHAAADISDGLIADLGHICEVSGVSADIEFDRVPLSAAAQKVVKGDTALHMALLAGGDDYQIVFTAQANAADEIAEASGESDTAVTRIGTVSEKGAGGPVRVIDSDGAQLESAQGGYAHF